MGQLLGQVVLLVVKFDYLIVHDVFLGAITLEETVQVQHELKCKFLLVFHHCLLLTVVARAIYVQK
jgi:hypothetical protein